MKKKSMTQIYRYYVDLGRPKAEALQNAREYGEHHNMEGWETFGEVAPGASREGFDPSGAIAAARDYIKLCRAPRAAGKPTPPPPDFETYDLNNPGTVFAYGANLTRDVDGRDPEKTAADAEEIADLIGFPYRYSGRRR